MVMIGFETTRTACRGSKSALSCAKAFALRKLPLACPQRPPRLAPEIPCGSGSCKVVHFTLATQHQLHSQSWSDRSPYDPASLFANDRCSKSPRENRAVFKTSSMDVIKSLNLTFLVPDHKIQEQAASCALFP